MPTKKATKKGTGDPAKLPWVRVEIQLTPRQRKALDPIFEQIDAAYERFARNGYRVSHPDDLRCSVLGQAFHDGAASFYLISPPTAKKILRATTKMKKDECTSA